MSFYDYRCRTCGHEESDIKRSIKEDVSIYKCSVCSGEMRQVYRKFGFKLKGAWFKESYDKNNIKKDSGSNNGNKKSKE